MAQIRGESLRTNIIQDNRDEMSRVSACFRLSLLHTRPSPAQRSDTTPYTGTAFTSHRRFSPFDDSGESLSTRPVVLLLRLRFLLRLQVIKTSASISDLTRLMREPELMDIKAASRYLQFT